MGSSNIILWVICVFLVLNEDIIGAQGILKTINIGVLVDPNTRIGKEQELGMKIGAEDFNKTSENVVVKLHFLRSSSTNPLQVASSVIDYINEKKIEAIITGTDNSEEVTLLGEIGNEYKVPVISLSATSLNPVKKKSFLVDMSNDNSVQIDCITSLINNFGWKKVIAVYEDGGYGSSSSTMLDLFAQSLQDIESQIEYRLAFPPLAFMSKPNKIIKDELVKVFSMQSRVFVILHSSLPLAVQLFKEANKMGLVGRESVWIITDSIASLLDALNSSTKSYMEGTLGIKISYDESTQSYATFRRNFLLKFLTQYPNDEDTIHFETIHALKAYDVITTIGKAMEMSRDILLQGILSSKFKGLSGEISFKNGMLDKDGMSYRIVNVVGKSYKEFDSWSPTSLSDNMSSDIVNRMLNGMVTWPGYIKDVPKGWTMPSNVKPLKIGVPGNPPFNNFVVIENVTSNQNRTSYTGFCIDIFLEALKIVEQSYEIPFEFEVFHGNYDDLVNRVYDKTYDIAVGDITIFANRSKYVEFTQPYTVSGLSMIVPLKSKDSQKARMFVRPFTWQLWLVTLATLLYTTLVVCFIETRIVNNADFQGGFLNQFNIALWFTFCSIFHAQRENIRSKLTRTTVTIWFVVMFALSSSYTASLTSMLTVPLPEPSKVKDVGWLIKTQAQIGCDGGSVWDYLINVLGINPLNIKNISTEYDYQVSFDNGSIVTAFLERPYQKLLVNQYCKSYTRAQQTFGFNGQGFVFQKGSPFVGDISRAMLKISENGVLQELEDKWFPTSSECLTSMNDHVVERLKPMEFLALYLIYLFISALCLFSYLATLIRRYRANTDASMHTNLLVRCIINFVQYFHGRGSYRNSQISPFTITHHNSQDDDDWETLDLSSPP